MFSLQLLGQSTNITENMAGEIPPRFTDLPVSKLSEGPPARYQLLTKKKSLDGQVEADSKLRRWTVGERDPTKHNKTILLVGETGAGKSTMINAMVNYVMGVKWEDKVWYEIVEQDEKLPAKRLTSEIKVYEIFGFEDCKVPYSLTIVNIRHGDTAIQDAMKKQNKVALQLYDLFTCETEIQEVDAVGIVMTEGTTLSEQLKFIYNSVVSLFGKDVLKNIVALITHSNGMSAHDALKVLEDAKIEFTKNEKKEPLHFNFQNVQDITITPENQKSSEFHWDLTSNSIKKFLDFLECAAHKIPCMGTVQHRMLSYNRAWEKSQRFKDLPVSKLSEGPLARYQLLTKKESLDGKDEADSRLRRWTVGERDPTKPNKTILLVGETGTGKSTLINAMVNYVMGVEWKDKVWYEIVVEGKHQQTMSQTADVTVYEMFGFEEVKVPYSVTIIDTPGFGATDGNDHDEMISQTLYDLFRCDKGIQEIDAVGLVLKATDNRLSDRLKYIFDAVISLFGKDLENSIVVLLTHSDGISTSNALQALKDAKVKCAKTEKNQPVHFMFNNCPKWEMTRENQEAYGTLWTITTQGMRAFFGFLDKASPKKLNTTLAVLIERIRLTACIGNLHNRIKLIEMKQTEIRQTQDALEKQKPVMQTKQKMVDETLEKLKSLMENKELKQENHESLAATIKKHQEIIETQKQEMEKNRNFTIEVDEPYKERVPIGNSWDNKAVCCLVCEETCHYPGCTLAINPWWCEVMKGGKCTSCTRRCDHTKHVKVKWRFVNKTRRVKKTLENVKERYEQNEKMIQETKSELENTLQHKKQNEISKQEITKEEEELSSQIKQLETNCKMYENEIRARESILINMKVEMKSLQADKARWVEEAYQHVAKLQEISLNSSSMSTSIYLDFLIEKMKETGDMEKVQRLEDIQKQCEDGRKDGIQYMAQRAGKYVWGKYKSLKSTF